MNGFVTLVRLDAKLAARHKLVHVTAAIALVFGLLIAFVVPPPFDQRLIPILFAVDLCVLGFMFGAVMILQDKEQATIGFYRVGPGTSLAYIAAKLTVNLGLSLLNLLILVGLGAPQALAEPALLMLVLGTCAGMTLLGMGLAVFFRSIAQFFFPLAAVGLLGAMPMYLVLTPSAALAWTKWLPTYHVLFGAEAIMLGGDAAVIRSAILHCSIFAVLAAGFCGAAVHLRLMREGQSRSGTRKPAAPKRQRSRSSAAPLGGSPKLARMLTMMRKDVLTGGRDQITLYMLLSPLLLGLLLALLLPILEPASGAAESSLRLVATSLTVYCVTVIVGLMMGFAILEEKITKIHVALDVSPLRFGEYLGAKLLLATLLAAALSVPAVALPLGVDFAWPSVLATVIASVPFAISLGLLVGVLAKDQLGAVAVMKGLLPIWTSLPILGFVLPDAWMWTQFPFANHWGVQGLFHALGDGVGVWTLAGLNLLTGLPVLLATAWMLRRKLGFA